MLEGGAMRVTCLMVRVSVWGNEEVFEIVVMVALLYVIKEFYT